jgi:DNA-binding protein H-NS
MATLQDLISQKESLEREIERLKEQSRGEAIEKVRALMAEYDLSLADIGVRGAAKTSPQTQAKPRKKAPAGRFRPSSATRPRVRHGAAAVCSRAG